MKGCFAGILMTIVCILYIAASIWMFTFNTTAGIILLVGMVPLAALVALLAITAGALCDL